MRKWLFFVAGVAVIVVWVFVLNKDPFIDTPRAGTNIIFFGDSLVEGIGATAGNDLASLLSRELEISVINAGRSGDTTRSALARLASDVLNNDPRVVVILLGGNDSINRIEPETTFANLETIIERIHEKGAAVLLVGIRGPFFGSEYQRHFERIAREHEVSFVPDVLDGIAGRPRFMADLIHPNDEGYAIIAGRIAPLMRAMLARSNEIAREKLPAYQMFGTKLLYE